MNYDLVDAAVRLLNQLTDLLSQTGDQCNRSSVGSLRLGMTRHGTAPAAMDLSPRVRRDRQSQSG